MVDFVHVPVLAAETLAALAPYSGGQYLDGTVGGGGHSSYLLAASKPAGFLLGIDRDDDALAAASAHLRPYSGRFLLRKGNYADMNAIAADAGFFSFNGILLDIGVSSHHLDNVERGFSFQQDAPLDMRMDRSQKQTAAELVNTASEAELTRILYAYGEERWAARIAAFIVEARAKASYETTGQLVDTIKRAIPAGAREKDQHPAKRSFQALRIAVNDELGALEKGIEAAIRLLAPKGRLAIISFHSLEDRIVKEKFTLHAKDCLCPPRQPVCTCQHQADVRLLTRKPISAGKEELEKNPRCRSARLRAVEKLGSVLK